MFKHVARILVVLSLPGAACLAGEADRFRSPTAGFAFEKAPTWVFMTLGAAEENRERIRPDDAELEKQMRERATPALVAAMRHPEPHPDLNPSFQVGLRPLGDLEGRTARQVLDLILPGLQRVFADLRVVEPVREQVVGGLPAAGVAVE
jgi:hypothetical protein